MSALPLDPSSKDFVFTAAGGMVLVPTNSVAECVQELNCRFGFSKGEWFLDQNQGFPYLQSILVKNPDTRAIAQLYRSMILATPGVEKVLSLPVTFDVPTRVLRWTAQIKHKSGAYAVGGHGAPFIVADNQARPS